MDSFKVNRISYAEMQRLVSKWAEEGIHPNTGEGASIEISEDGYWVINGVKTEYKAVTEVPVKSVNGKTGDVQLSAADVGADAAGTAAAKTSALQETLESKIRDARADAISTATNNADGKLSRHNVDETAHSDIRNTLTELKSVIEEFFAKDADTDETLDRLVEIVNIINSNKESIDAIATDKVDVKDIIDNLTTNVANKPLSAAKGVYLKALIDSLDTSKLDASALTNAINTALAQAKQNGEFDGKDGKDGFSVFYVKEDGTQEPDNSTEVPEIGTTVEYLLENIETNGRTIQKGDCLLDGSLLYFVIETERSSQIVTCKYFVNLKGDDGADGKDGKDGKDGEDYVLTDTDKKDIAEEAVAILNDDGIPDYWYGAFTDRYGNTYTKYLDEKIAAIKALQDEGGKDCFSFVVMTDIHYKQNLGRRSPAIAKKIMDECDIKFALCFGDVQNREPYSTKAQVEAEWGDIRTMFAPIAENVLMQKGNHDGSWGTLNGTQYAFNFTPAELYNRVYASTYKYQNAVTDESGTAYYVDDTARKIRFIMLNTTCNPYEENEDGSAKYNNMTHTRLTQTQFDFLTKNALVTVPDNDWSVILGGHHPLWKAELKDAEVLIGVLGAYKSKSEDGYVGEYEGTADIGDAYKNLATPDEVGTEATSPLWLTNFKIGSTGISSGVNGTTVCNTIYRKDGSPIQKGDVIRVKGVNFRASNDRFMISGKNNAGTENTQRNYISNLKATVKEYEDAGQTPVLLYSLIDDVHTFTVVYNAIVSDGNIRFAFETPTDPSTVIITVNEEIKAGARYDAVSVNANFSEAKGNFVSYFCGHNHTDMTQEQEISGIRQVLTRCDAPQEHTEADRAERVKDTITEQSFDVFTVNKKTRTIHATKIGAGQDRTISY